MLVIAMGVVLSLTANIIPAAKTTVAARATTSFLSGLTPALVTTSCQSSSSSISRHRCGSLESVFPRSSGLDLREESTKVTSSTGSDTGSVTGVCDSGSIVGVDC